jgi:hypothetical protein
VVAVTSPRFVGPVRRVKVGRNHVYRDANGARVPGVTSLLGDGVPKPALINWAGNATAEAAIDRWDELAGMSPAKRLAALQKARYADRDQAANRGTEVHTFAERYIAGEEVPIPDAIAGHVESYVQFVDDWQPDPVLIEAVVMSHRHGYAGTLDLIAEIPGRGRVLLDVKTSRSGIFGETALQLAAYRYADVFLDEQGLVDEAGREQPLPQVDEVLGLHVRGDGYELRPIEAGPEQFREFLYVMQVAHFTKETSSTYVGDPLEPARRMKRRRLEVVAEPEPPAPRRTARREGATT